MLDVAVIEDPAAAEVSLDPVRARLLAELAEPGVGDHAGRPGRAAEAEGELPPAGAGAARAGRAGRGAAQGQLHRAGAAGDGGVVRDLAGGAGRGPARPGAGARPGLGGLAAGGGVPARPRRRRPDDRAARPPGSGWRRSRSTGEVRFASAADRAAFAEELAGAVAGLVARYHDPTAAGGRDHRLVVALHPSVNDERRRSPSDAAQVRAAQGDHPPGHPRAGVGGDRHRPRDRRLVHGPERGRAARGRPDG